MLKVFGHKNPDTDTICSAIVYAWYLTQQRQQEAKAYAQGPLSRETEYVLNRFNVTAPDRLEELTEEDSVVIVDTNNPEELPDTIDQAKLVEIIDHHKLVGGLSTGDVLSVTLRPVGCTATIIWQIMQEDGAENIPQDMAGLMLSCILSDTLKFTSPTTTDVDKAAGEALAEIAGVDIDELADQLFKIKSDLTGMDPRDILLSDSKVFEFPKGKVRLSTLETVAPEQALLQKEHLLEAMRKMKEEEQLDGLFFFIVDILAGYAILLLVDTFETVHAQVAFQQEVQEQMMQLPGVVSRKKQMVPPLEEALS